MILVLDNYDSFTYNLVQYLGELGCEVEVHRNDAITVREIVTLEPSHIVISPGPCTPNEAGISLELVEKLSGRIPILGVCLGHQAIGQAFGGRIEHARAVMHGKISVVEHDGRGVFAGLPGRFTATRYHSLVVAPGSVPACLEVSAWCDDGQGNIEVMGLRHLELAVEGVQFHPESILTEHGRALLKNFLAA